jgi:hypothetical protein
MALLASALAAQSGPDVARAPSPEDAEKQALFKLLDDIRAAIRREDWARASVYSIWLNAGVWDMQRAANKVSTSLELNRVELLAGRDPITRNPFLPRLAKAAFASLAYTKAGEYAREALEASKHGVFWWTGDAIHQGNIVLGRLALQEGDVAAAARYLLAAGKTTGSSNLNSLGPNMALARDLLGKGETEAVLEYLTECESFWKGSRGKLAEWKALIKAGLKPDFGPNLEY